MARHGDRPRDRRPRHQARALGRRQHPRRRAHGHGVGVPPDPPPRQRSRQPAIRRSSRRSAPARSTSSPASTPTAPSGCSPTARRSAGRASARGRGPTVSAAGTPRRGHRRRRSRCSDMRIADADGAWMPHPDDRRLLIPVPADGPAAGHDSLPAARRRNRPRLRQLHDPDAAPAGSARPQSQLPGRVGPGVPGSGDHPLSEPEDRRARPRHRRPSQHLRLQRLPHVGRRDPATVVDRRRLDVAAGRRLGLEAARRARHGAHRVHVALGLRGLHVGSVGHDERRRRRLGVRAPRHLRLDHRVLGRRPDGHRSQAVDPLLVPRPDRRGGARRAAVVRRTPSGRPRRLVPVRPPAARIGRARRLGRLSASGTTRRSASCAPRSPRTPSSPSTRRCARRASRSVGHVGDPTRCRHRGASRSASPTPAGCRPTSAERARKERLVKPIVVELTGDGRGPCSTSRRAVRSVSSRDAPRCGSADGNDGTPDRVLVTWTVMAERAPIANVVAKHDRSGQVSLTCPLE